jgi:2,4-dienoyl-CoA reductase-like NADH-dependent reductase (Old Yellow Enzyme family)
MSTPLFESLAIRDRAIPNRVMVSPMCQYSCETDGMATDWHRVHLGSRATGGAGIVMTEATAVEARGRISPHDLGIWTDEQATALASIAQFIEQQGSIPAIQLAHAGRKGSTARPWDGGDRLPPEAGGWEPVAPSAIARQTESTEHRPRAMTEDDIESLIDAFAAAAARARDAGFKIAEVHAAHGYLLHEFLSPVTNQRTDRFGGSFENRVRLVEEVTEAVRAEWPAEEPVFVRISATDWLPARESWTIEDSVKLAPRLVDAGADLIDVSAGGIHPDQQIPHTGPNYQVPLAERIRAETGAMVGAVGSITTPEQADAIIGNGRADLAIVGREHLRDPYFTLRAAEALGAEDAVQWPIQYRRAVGR